jgi:hypothetical protein
MLSFFFIYQIYLVAVFSLYKVFKVAFLKYEIVDKIQRIVFVAYI